MGDGAWDRFPHLKRLQDEIGARPAAARVTAFLAKWEPSFKATMDDEGRRHMFRFLKAG
jgi:GSH-dependent disulfide-bond oxidoreductase